MKLSDEVVKVCVKMKSFKAEEFFMPQSDATQRAKIAEKVHKPTLGVSVIIF